MQHTGRHPRLQDGKVGRMRVSGQLHLHSEFSSNVCDIVRPSISVKERKDTVLISSSSTQNLTVLVGLLTHRFKECLRKPWGPGRDMFQRQSHQRQPLVKQRLAEL